MAVDVSIKKNLGAFSLDVHFQSESRRIGILGASGSGKSLTLKSIAGIEQPDEGRISVNGSVFYDSDAGVSWKPQKRRVGYLFQNYALFPAMTVEENIAAGLAGTRKEKAEKVKLMMARFGLEGLEGRYPRQLSGGQQQRVALARILAYEPEVILLDEPFSALDVYLRDQVQREFMEMIAGYKGTVILVSHNRDEIYRLSREVLVIEKGKISGQGETKAFFRDPRSVSAARITGCKNIAQAVRAKGKLLVPSWKMELASAEALDVEHPSVGIRAHQFCIRKPEEDALVFSVYDPTVTEDLFEYNISFRPHPEAAGKIDWKISKYLWEYQEKKIPGQLFLRKRDLLFLDSDK